MSDDSKKVLVVLPVVGQPRFSKRIDMMLERDHDVRVAAFERPYHRGRTPNCEIIYLGKIENQQYLQRIPKLVAAIFKLRTLLKQCDVVYALGIDLILLSMLAGVGLKHGRMLEIGDVTKIQTSQSLSGRLVRQLDSFICKRLDFLVVTAPLFLSAYYREWVGAKTSALVLENKVESAQADNIKQTLNAENPNPPNLAIGTVIGYFGLLQSRWSWRVLKLLANGHPETHSVLLAGRPTRLEGVEEAAKLNDNLTFFGEYKSPDDLPELYGKIDMAWACYSPMDPEDWNLRWARTNRFYEACAYETPLLCRKGSDDARVVAEYNIGHIVEDEEDQAAMVKIAAITQEQIAVWRKNMQELPRQVYAYTDESEQLSNAIITAAGRSL